MVVISNYAGVTNVELAYTQLNVNQCPGEHIRNVYANSAVGDRNAFRFTWYTIDRETTECQYQTISEEEIGFDLASYRCVCKIGYEYSFNSMKNYFEGAIIEREYMASESTIDIVPLLPEHRQPVMDLLMRSFFIQEPLNNMLKFDIPHEPLPWANHAFDNALHDQCSFVAIDTTTPQKDFVGVILNGISNKAEEDSFVIESEKLKFIFSLIDQVMDGYDLFELYKTDRLFHCDVINIDEKQRGHNLSVRLITKSLDKARQLDIKGAYVVCSSLFSRKAFMRHGFQVINELLYSKHEDKRLLNMGIHDRCTLLGKQL
ncbi:unnamed protein product [Rotaria sp. Silwood1]|nr:unnamed protein product [Rotaria sp. Silwood1]